MYVELSLSHVIWILKTPLIRVLNVQTTKKPFPHSLRNIGIEKPNKRFDKKLNHGVF